MSIANPPGDIAQAVWRSAPCALTIGPSGGLNKSNEEDDYVYHRRIVYFGNDEAKVSPQVEGVEIIAGESKSVLPFSRVEKDSRLTSELVATFQFESIALPLDAESLALAVLSSNKEAGRLCQDDRIALQMDVNSTSTNAGPVLVSLGGIPASGELKRSMRLVIPIRHLRGQVASLAPAFTNLDVDKSRGALIHVASPQLQIEFSGRRLRW